MRLLSKQIFMLEELQVLPKALRAMQRMKGAGLCLAEEGRSLGGGTTHPHHWSMEWFITDTRVDESPTRGHFLRTPFSDHCQQKTQSYQELKKEKHKIAWLISTGSCVRKVELVTSVASRFKLDFPIPRT